MTTPCGSTRRSIAARAAQSGYRAETPCQICGLRQQQHHAYAAQETPEQVGRRIADIALGKAGAALAKETTGE